MALRGTCRALERLVSAILVSAILVSAILVSAIFVVFTFEERRNQIPVRQESGGCSQMLTDLP
jgi:hypothetical protein